MKPHKHAELIKAWADGHTIERLWTDWKNPQGTTKSWLIDNEPDWSEFEEYRIKPEPNPNLVKTLHIWFDNEFSEITLVENTDVPNLKLIFDGETGELKSAEVLK